MHWKAVAKRELGVKVGCGAVLRAPCMAVAVGGGGIRVIMIIIITLTWFAGTVYVH